MGIIDRVGKGISEWLMPYITDNFKNRGEQMPKKLQEREDYKLQEHYLWFLGQEDLLADFYQTRTITTNLIDVRREYYYANANNSIRIVHSGLPSLISYSKVKLLLSGGLEHSVTDLKQKELKKETELLDEIAEDNNIETLIKNSALTESWGKRFAWKISYDPEVSEYPILEMYKPFNYRTEYKRGRLQKIVFINCYEKENRKYELEEEYGKGYIDYFLFMITDNGRVPVTLEELEETSGLTRIEFDRNYILACEKENLKSDYDGLISEFDALDETWSQLMDEIRLGRSETYIPDVLLENKVFNKFRKNFVELGTDERENGKNEIKHIQPEIRSDEYKNTIGILTNNCLTSVGLSPYTVGIDDNVGANASGENLAKREMTSLRTREDMVKGWEEFLEEVLEKLMYANALFNGTAYKEIEIEVSFGDYISPTREEKIANAKTLKDAEIIDAEKALDEVYGDELEEEEKLRILANMGDLSFEEDISL